MKKEIISLQILRGFAAIAIVFIHMNAIIKKYGASNAYLFPSTELANAGVDVFFVISGVIMAIITQGMDASPQKAAVFLWKRITRVYPIYWFYLILFILGNLLIQGTIIETSGEFTLAAILQSAFLIPNQNLPILIIAWTLEYEIYFYFIFAVLLAWGKQDQLAYLAGFTVIIVAVGSFIQVEFALWSLMSNPLLLEFTAGVFLGSLYQRGLKLNPYILAGVATMLLGLEIIGWSLAEIFDMYGTRFGRFTRFGLPAIFVVAAFLFANDWIASLKVTLLKQIGDASYSLYLSHLLILSIAGKFWSILALATYLPDGFFAAYLLSTSILWSLFSYNFIERPLIKALRRSYS